MQSLTRLRNLQITSNLDETEVNIIEYLRHVNPGIIDTIKETDGIYDYYQVFLNFNLPPGLYAIDSQRIYTPIDSGQFGRFHLVSIPKDPVPLYGITNYRFSKILYTDKYIIIFVGCTGTCGDNRFLNQVKGFTIYTSNANDEHSIIPVAGARPHNELSYIFASNPDTSIDMRLRDDTDVPRIDTTNTTNDDEEEEEEQYADDYETN
jgi:hypothetical protein